MDFTFTDEQQMLRDSVSNFLARHYDFDARQKIVKSGTGYSLEIWSQIAELGLLALPLGEDAGGLGGGAVELVAIAEPFGAHLLAEPYVASAQMAASMLERTSRGETTQEWLDKAMTGEAVIAFAYEEGRGTPDPAMISTTLERTDGEMRLSGEKRMVLAGGEAQALVVVARYGDGLAAVLVDPQASGVSITDYPTVDGRRAANIRFDNVAVSDSELLSDDAAGALSQTLDIAMLGLCAESVGAMGALLARTAEYAATRKQFGVPIASFQAVAHRIADMKIAYSKARATLLYTAALLESGRASERDMAILKGQTGKLGRLIGESAIQTHGGVGMTDELAIGHLHKRILANDAMLGSSEYHLRKLGTL